MPSTPQRRLVRLGNGVVFNVLDNRDPVTYEPFTEAFRGFPNPDFGRPFDPARGTTAFRAPRQVRLGARFEW